MYEIFQSKIKGNLLYHGGFISYSILIFQNSHSRASDKMKVCFIEPALFLFHEMISTNVTVSTNNKFTKNTSCRRDLWWYEASIF